MLLHKGAHGHMHNPIEQLVLLAALAVIARTIPLRLYIILILSTIVVPPGTLIVWPWSVGLGQEQPVRPAAKLFAVGGIGRVELVWLDLRLELLDAL